MGSRGRKSVGAGLLVAFPQRPKPPKELTPRQSKTWKAILHSLPANYLPRSAFDLFAQYCRHQEAAETLSAWINEIPQEELRTKAGLAKFDKLGRMRLRESQAIMRLSTKLRFAVSSRIRAEKAVPTHNVAYPWDDPCPDGAA